MMRAAFMVAAAIVLAAPIPGVEAQVPQGTPVNATLHPIGDARDSMWIVVLGNGDTLHVITSSAHRENRRAFAERRAFREKAAVLDSLVAPYERTVNACLNVRALDAEMIRLQGEQIADYRRLTTRLERLTNPWMTWEAGVGRDSAGPALMAGIGVKRLRGFVTAHEGRTAWFVGYSGRVF